MPRARGASIHRFTPVLETNARSDGSWDVVTDKGTIHADIVVNAAGLWRREVAAIGRRLPSVADRDGEYYLRQEGQGLLVGAYERDGKFWAEAGTPLDFGQSAGVKRVINGPMIWSPDSAALFGPVPELKNYFCCNGIIPGFSQSGGLGMLLAQWIVEGETELDMFPWDMSRYGDWATKAFTKARARSTCPA